MATKYIAVDCGKHAVKACEYDPKTNTVRRLTFHTRTAPGDFRDDALEKNTYLAKIGNEVLKIGNGARGDGADLNTSKKNLTHRDCTLFAISQFCSGTDDEVHVAVGLPAKDWAVVSKREDYKEYLFKEGAYSIQVKTSSTSDVAEKKFKIVKSYVFPESIGALFQDDSPAVNETSFYGVLDIGNVNLNATVWQGVELQQDISITDELGAASLILGLSQELSAEFTRCDERMTAKILSLYPDNRCLRPNNGDKDIMRRSKELIDRYLLDHARKIKRACDGRKWSLDYMTLVAIGGTSIILKDQLKQVFGENLTILENQTFANALGFLRMMCMREHAIGKIIPLNFEETAANKEKAGKAS